MSKKYKAMEDDKKFEEAINRLASNSARWLEIKKLLEDDIRLNQELILLIDQKVNNIAKLN